jgi:sensor histidine kinase regulating citrate/malate metabolism
MIYKYIRPPFLYMLRNSDNGWLGFSIIPISYSILLYSIGMYNINEVIDKFSVKYGVLLFIMVFSVYFLFLRFFKQTREQLILQNEQNLLKNQMAAAQLYFQSLEESQKKTILYRHDMRHHLNLINSYLIDNNKDSAQRYIAEVERTIDTAVVEKYCTNYTVNLILYSYLMHAKKEYIEVKTQIDLPEQNIVSDMDLCVIFGNAIENAINACKGILNVNDRFLKIVCKTKQDKLFIQITNSYEGKVEFADDIPISTKENHGLGTKSIAAIAQKYGGVYSFTAEEGVFTTSIIL